MKGDIIDLPTEDTEAYVKLKDSFINSRSSRHISSFSQEVLSIVRFIDRRSEDKEKRAMACGFAYLGLFIGVNTKILKRFIGRCKSSINNGFQQFGYISIKTKDKAKSCLQQILPSLDPDSVFMRQWTVRFPSQPANARFMLTGMRTASQAICCPIVLKPKPILLPLPVVAYTPVTPIPLPLPMIKRSVSKEESELLGEDIIQKYTENDFIQNEFLENDFDFMGMW